MYGSAHEGAECERIFDLVPQFRQRNDVVVGIGYPSLEGLAQAAGKTDEGLSR